MKQRPTVLLWIEKSRAYGRELIRGISKYVHMHSPWDYMLMPVYHHGGSKRWEHFSEIHEDQIDGVIIHELSERAMRRVLELRVPTIVAWYLTERTKLPFIMTECDTIGQLAAEHLLARGFKNFGYCGLDEFFWSRRREKSFGETVAKAGFEVRSYSQTKKCLSWGAEQSVLVKWLEGLPKPVGVLACTDDRAEDVVDACVIANLRVPEEVAVVGVDDDELVCDMADVPISSVVLDVQRAGYEAAEMLDRLMRGAKCENQGITVRATHVNIRRSTDVLAVDDPYVARAVNFIHSHANEPMQVSDVEKEVMLSGRNLFDRFRKELRRTVFQEITRVRIERLCMLLESTTLSTCEIAQTMGFPDDKHLARYFRRLKGVSPVAWRKQVWRLSHP